jgi:chlorobactene glucosyltransferase
MWQTVQTLYGYILVGIGVFFLTFSGVNHIWQLVCTKKPQKRLPKNLHAGEIAISVMIPARNEEHNIGSCIESFLHQDYSSYEILVIDDNSEDNTWQIIAEYTRKYPDTVRAFKGKALPHDWQGKCWALDQLVKEARGHYLLFTDADTRHSPQSLAFAVTNLEANRADMISGYTYQIMKTFGEKITVPVQYMLTAFFLLLPLNSLFKKIPFFSPAIGQYIGVNRKKFIELGGWSLVKKTTTEDIFIARKCKEAGYRTFFINCTAAVSCRMFSGFREAQVGIAKNIFDFFGRISVLLFLAAFAILMFLILPVFLGFFKLFHIMYVQDISLLSDPFTICLALNIIFTFFTWIFLFISQRLPACYALLYPILFVNLLYIALLSWYRAGRKGYVWKGRLVN